MLTTLPIQHHALTNKGLSGAGSQSASLVHGEAFRVVQPLINSVAPPSWTGTRPTGQAEGAVWSALPAGKFRGLLSSVRVCASRAVRSGCTESVKRWRCQFHPGRLVARWCSTLRGWAGGRFFIGGVAPVVHARAACQEFLFKLYCQSMSSENPFLHFVVEPALLARVDDFRSKYSFATCAAAVRWLLDAALDVKLARPKGK
jgi:hypothetical protein